MKVLVTENEIINLENVRRVERRCNTSKHTCKGVPYLINHYSIVFIFDGSYQDLINCGTNEKGKEKADKIFNEVYEILSK
jgi:hypothetical protein